MSAFRLISVLLLGFILAGCSTKAWVKLPQDTKIQVNEGKQFSQGLMVTRPFFWNKAGGVPYKLINNDGEVIDEGKLRTRFRVSSIFWPPYSIIYWPLGFGSRCYNVAEQSLQHCTREEERDVRYEYRYNR